MKGTVFYKVTGSGNDFIVLDGRYAAGRDWTPARIAAVCDRRHGVGADGFVLLTPEAAPRVRMDYFNADGSRASMCGNAGLCCVRLAAWLEMAPATGVELLTDIGLVRGRCIGPEWLAEIDLPEATAGRPVEGIEAEPGESGFWLSRAGVPHLVVAVADVDRVDVEARGRTLRFHPALGQEGANVNFIQLMNGAAGERPALRIRTYERGVEGETLACGTGCVGAAVTTAALGLTPLPTRLQTASGKVVAVSAELGDDGRARLVSLCGEGRLVFRGVLV
ncbi:MAG: diaminopimelate epimerase [Gemmatimonadota bacterium]